MLKKRETEQKKEEVMGDIAQLILSCPKKLPKLATTAVASLMEN